jgi:hypothetical protein
MPLESYLDMIESNALRRGVLLRPRILLAAMLFVSTTALAQQNAAAPAVPAPQAGQTAADARGAAWWTAAAKLLAGIDGTLPPEFAALAKRPSVAQHRAAFTKSWERFDKERLTPATAFAARELTPHPSSVGPVFYPFSGPDVLYAAALFPNAADFALTGLEPVGDLPDLAKLDEPQLAASLAEVRRSLNAILAFSFFRTNDMRAEFAHNRFSGVTPILLLFLARHNATIAAVEPFILEPDMNLRLVSAAAVRNVPADRIGGVRIAFQLGTDGRDRRLYYFSADVSDKGLSKTPQYIKWMTAYTPRATLVKSASYLMHKSYFSEIRNLILERSTLVVQDDSGIPLRLFADNSWERRMYGAYVGPIPLFANWYQKDMKAAYDKSATPIDFGIGYQFVSRRSNLQVFSRRTASARAG